MVLNSITQIFREDSGSGREDTGRLGCWKSLEEIMGTSDLLKKPQGFSEEILTLTMLVNQKKSCPLTMPTGKVTRLSFLNVSVGFETLHVSFGPRASGVKAQSCETLSMVFVCQQTSPCTSVLGSELSSVACFTFTSSFHGTFARSST